MGFYGRECVEPNKFLFRKEWNEILKDFRTNLNEWLVSRGALKLPENLFHPHSPYQNIYVYPNGLDYKVKNLLPPKWLRFECLMRESKEQFSIPEELISKSGKLVYLSMGKFGSSDLDLMKRVTTILSESLNKFIVSKGSFHDKYELPENMWGLEMLPQTSVLPLIDLVITYEDNKSIIDAFYFSKPLVVLPLFGDQLDNAQRVKENGFGLTLNPHTCNRR
jgi:UDP:flavonoid glycosyltransferase YjiC (YdhE family)